MKTKCRDMREEVEKTALDSLVRSPKEGDNLEDLDVDSSAVVNLL
jgi:hypothetical protein